MHISALLSVSYELSNHKGDSILPAASPHPPSPFTFHSSSWMYMEETVKKANNGFLVLWRNEMNYSDGRQVSGNSFV